MTIYPVALHYSLPEDDRGSKTPISLCEAMLESYASSPPKSFPDQCGTLDLLFQDLQKLKGTGSDKRIDGLIAKTLIHYAKAHYADNFNVSKNLYLYAITFDLARLDSSFKTQLPCELHEVKTLEELKAFLNDERSKPLEESITSNGKDVLSTGSLSPEELHSFAASLRMLGHCVQNIDRYKPEKGDEEVLQEGKATVLEKKIKFYEDIYHTSEKLLIDLENRTKAQFSELTELYYNSWPFLYLLKNPHDYDGAFKSYELAAQRDTSPNMEARILNVKACTLVNEKRKYLTESGDAEGAQKTSEQALEYFRRAYGIRSGLYGNDPFLLANVKNSFAKSLLEVDPVRHHDEAKSLLSEAVSYAESEHAKGNYHQYHAFYFQGLAKVHAQEQDFSKAKSLMETAIRILEKNSESEAKTLQSYRELHKAYEEKLL